MSIYSINPANSPVIAQVSGSTFIATSGSVGAVVIGGTIGTGTFADVNSSVSTDDLSTGSDALVTQAFNYGFNQANGQWTRIFSVPTRSGVKSTTMPTSGFALLTATRIVGTTEIADVFDSAEDDMKAADVVLQVGARTYGYNRESGSASGSFWPRIDAILQRSTDDFVRWKAADSGVGLRTFTQIMGYDDDISQVFTLDSDDAFGDKGLFVKSHNSAWVDSSGTWVRLRATQSGQGMSGIPHKLAVDYSGAISFIGASGVILGVPKVADINGYNFDDGGVFDRRLLVQAGLVGYDQINNWYSRLRLTTSGVANSMSGIQIKLAVAFSGDIVQIGEGGQIVQVDTPNGDTLSTGNNSLDTIAFTFGYNTQVNAWTRLRSLAVSSGQTQLSGLQMPFSGYFLGTASQIIDMAGTIANVTPASDDDIEGVNLGMLDTMSKNYAYHDQQSGWARLRAFALSSGQTQSFSTTLPFSGYVLGTAALLTDVGGRIANMGDTDDDAKGITENAVDTNAILRGFDQVTNALVRIRATASGAAFSGIHHKLAVAFSGDIVQIGEGGTVVDVQSAGADTMSNSDNAFTTTNRQMAYDQSGDQWRRVRGIGTESGGMNFAMFTKAQEPDTFLIFVEAATLTSGRMFLAIRNRGDKVIKIKDIRVLPVEFSLISGKGFVCDVSRFEHVLSGSRLNIKALDSRNDNFSGLALDAVFNATNISGASLTQYTQNVLYVRGLDGPNPAMTSGLITSPLMGLLAQQQNLAPTAGLDGVQPITLSSGYGCVVGQATSFGQASGGSFHARMVFTIEQT